MCFELGHRYWRPAPTRQPPGPDDAAQEALLAQQQHQARLEHEAERRRLEADRAAAAFEGLSGQAQAADRAQQQYDRASNPTGGLRAQANQADSAQRVRDNLSDPAAGLMTQANAADNAQQSYDNAAGGNPDGFQNAVAQAIRSTSFSAAPKRAANARRPGGADAAAGGLPSGSGRLVG